MQRRKQLSLLLIVMLAVQFHLGALLACIRQDKVETRALFEDGTTALHIQQLCCPSRGQRLGG